MESLLDWVTNNQGYFYVYFRTELIKFSTYSTTITLDLLTPATLKELQKNWEKL